VTAAPETRYAKAPDGVHIAYQVVGDGPLDLVFVPGFVSHVEFNWEDPALAHCFERLASFSRLIKFDKRGTGMSDRTGALPDIDQRMQDVVAVMDAIGIDHAALMGVSEGAPMAILFAATYPQRADALVLFGAYARFLRAPDYAFGLDREDLNRFSSYVEERWGTGVGLAAWAPSVRNDPKARESWARMQRLSASPGAATALYTSYADIDVRPALPLVSAPTLVVHRKGDRMIPVEAGRYIAERIPGARIIEYEGTDHMFWTQNPDVILDDIEEFLTGVRPVPEPDRVLATVLFTDIVESTPLVVELGDRRWRDLLDRHDALAQRHVERSGGRVVKHTGDGLLAMFDGPARAIRCAAAIRDGASALGIAIRGGAHVGEVELRGADLAGVAVHAAQRVCAAAAPGEVLVSRTLVDLVAGSGIAFEDRGERVLKGLPGEWRLFAAQV
jgi:pimeloyl-ACP methyl ester carboxylesterase